MVVLINGSPRRQGNTRRALEIVARALEAEGVETDILQLGGKNVRGCQSCGACSRLKNGRCAIDDDMNEILEKIWQADGIVIGSPTYFSNVSSEVKALIDRAGVVSGANGGLLRGKVGAAAVAVRRAGSNFTFAAINFLFTKCEMPVASAGYWNMTLAHMPGDIEGDEEGIRTFETLGKNMAFMVKKLRS